MKEKSSIQILSEIKEIKVIEEDYDSIEVINDLLARGLILFETCKSVSDSGSEKLYFYLGRIDKNRA